MEFITNIFTYRNLVIWSGVCTYVLAAIMFTFQVPFYPKEAEGRGIQSEQYGFVFGVFELSSILFNLPLGMTIPRLGPQRVLLSGIILEGASSVLFGFLVYVTCHRQFLIFSLLLRILGSLGHVGVEVAVLTILQIKYPDIEAAVGGWTQMGFAVGMVVGPFLGGVLYDLGGFILPFEVLGAVIFLSFIPSFYLFKVDESVTGESETEKNMMKEVLQVPEVWIGVISNSLCSFASESFFNPILEPYLRRFDLTGTAVGSVVLCKGLGYLISTPFWSYAANIRKVSPHLLLTLSLVFQSVGVSLLGPLPFIPLKPMIWLIGLGMVLIGIGVGGTCTPSFNQMYNACIERGVEYNTGTKAVLSGLFLFGFSIGGFAGPSVAGILDSAIGFRYTSFVVTVALTVFTAILIPFTVRDIFIKRSTEKGMQK